MGNETKHWYHFALSLLYVYNLSSASLSIRGRQLVLFVADLEALFPNVTCAMHKQTWTTRPEILCSTRGSSQPDKNKSDRVPVGNLKRLSTIWFWTHPRGANLTRLEKEEKDKQNWWTEKVNKNQRETTNLNKTEILTLFQGFVLYYYWAIEFNLQQYSCDKNSRFWIIFFSAFNALCCLILIIKLHSCYHTDYFSTLCSMILLFTLCVPACHFRWSSGSYYAVIITVERTMGIVCGYATYVS